MDSFNIFSCRDRKPTQRCRSLPVTTSCNLSSNRPRTCTSRSSMCPMCNPQTQSHLTPHLSRTRYRSSSRWERRSFPPKISQLSSDPASLSPAVSSNNLSSLRRYRYSQWCQQVRLLCLQSNLHPTLLTRAWRCRRRRTTYKTTCSGNTKNSRNSSCNSKTSYDACRNSCSWLDTESYRR